MLKILPRVQNMKFLITDVTHEDGITQKDVNIAIVVSVVVTAVVIVALFGIIYFLRRKCNCKYYHIYPKY